MEEILIKFVESTPSLALLTIVIYIHSKAAEKREEFVIQERQKFLESLDNSTELSMELSKQIHDTINGQTSLLQSISTSILDAHVYRKREHEEMIEILEKLNGK